MEKGKKAMTKPTSPNGETKPANKILKITLIVVLSIIGFLALVFFGIRAYFMLPVSDYYSVSEETFEIPKLDEGFVPQGFCYDSKNQVFLVSGYDVGDKPSSVHVIDKNTQKTVHSVDLKKKNGKDFTGHAGGIAQYDKWVYVAGSSTHCIYVFLYEDVLTKPEATCVGEFSLEVSDDDYIKASFLSACDGKLIVGEFHSEPSYKTQDSHKVTTKSGQNFGGLAVEYVLSTIPEFGISPTPQKVYALPDKVQGVHFDKENFYLSTSHGLNLSTIYEMSASLLPNEGTIEILGRKLPLYSMDQTAIKRQFKTPPMAEEITVVDGKLYIMSEFACNKYILGKFTSAYRCYATDLSKI